MNCNTTHYRANSSSVPGDPTLILKHDINAPVAGLETFPRSEWPPVAIIFWSFRIMVGLGVLMIILGLASLAARALGRLYDWRLLHWFALAMGPAGYIAVIAGWVTTEVGRQPWTVYGLLRTADSLSPIAAPAIASSLAAFAIVYFLVFAAGFAYLLRLMARPPELADSGAPSVPIRTAGIVPGQEGA